MDFTVAIPTYNGESRLPVILERLQLSVTILKTIEQSHPDLLFANIKPLAWEIIVIDNNSSDHTAQVVKEFQSDWFESVPLKYFFEPKQGLAFARQRAVKEAQGEFIGFLDDDNLPTVDWVKVAYAFGRTHQNAGAYSGQIHGDFEVPPPDNFHKIQAFLAIREHGYQPYLFEPENLRLPPGAGLVVRKQAWCESIPIRTILSGRVGGKMVAGEDYEVLLHMHRAGWKIWYNPQMHIHHLIPRQRLERNYLLPLARGIGLATCQLRMINSKKWQKPLVLIRTMLGNLRRVVLHIIKYRWRCKTDLIAAFELEFLLGSVLSPFYFLQRSIQDKLWV
ncbi:MAG: glycosyltransferase family 2 protein [Symploca sp. SIO1C4]|uniref:Glycosyltransferase family 2 protein n=1 Tax=Symploca sp. SIO1C4 TaxID=2607765 RepID=A0A6B3N7A6_9CYAN|nr:glycosyltransferase family 2 protein [Symploca sp. SIO1C4]